MLDSQLALHNQHLDDAKTFADKDPQLKTLKHQTYAYYSPLLNELPIDTPGVYTITEGEVDIAYVHKQKFWPIEVKWAGQLRTKDLKQIQKYANGIFF